MNPWTWTREFILVERCSNLRTKTEKAFSPLELFPQLNLISMALLLMNGTQALRCCHTPMNESGMNPIGRGCSFINMDELLATVTIENELLNEGGCSSRLVHYSQLTIGKILHSIELPTRLNDSHWMWASVPATECVP